jgi:hypothetical protein
MDRLAIENRIAMLRARKNDNSRIIKKLERQLRALDAKK